LKIDKYIKDLSKKLDSFSSSANGNDYYYDDNYGLNNHDDEYYLDRKSEPPRFAYYRHIRIEKSTDEWRKKTFEAANDSITQDELEYSLKSWYWRQRDKEETGYDGYGCNNGECIPECRFYPEYGRIEDELVIEEHNKLVESYRQKNSIIDPPSESELLKLAKIYRFS
jgi:hypothetical protein